MSEDASGAEPAAPTVSQAQLQKAEAYVEAEEGVVNRLFGWAGRLVTSIAVAMSLFHLYAAVAGAWPFTDFPIIATQPLRYAHVAFVLMLSFLLFPLSARFRDRIRWWDIAAGIMGAAILVYAIEGGEEFTDRATMPTHLDVVLGVIFIILLLEATRRTTGWIVPFVALSFMAYAMAGPYLPPPWTHRGYDISQLVGHLFITLDGIFGIPVDVSSSLIILFTIYGAFLQHSGAGKFFIDFSMALMGHKANSAGRTVVLSSFLLGGPSGSGVATTVTIGAVAYPLMQRAGFEKNAAGGLLAAGGLGAIISPPVLGAAAFLIAEFLKISYLDVIWMATIPTCLYYLSLLFMVELDAKRFGAHTVDVRQELTLWQMTRRYGFHFVSLVSIIIFMLWGYSPTLAVFWSTVLTYGKIDAFFWVGGLPTAAVTDLGATPNVKIKLIDHADTVDKMNAKYANLYATGVIPAKTYPGQDKDNAIAVVQNILVANAKMADKVAYDIVKTFIEKRDELAIVHAEAKNITLENQSLKNSPIPWHPGALKYFAEQGVKM